MESELFGHMRGSFTGATSDRKGAFREADGGTLFLDEIGDMDIAMQAKILRALQERIITPVGGKSVQVDVRVIAATHHDLGQRIHEGRFREDLFYRLNVAPIVLPPLWERTADIVPPPSSSQKYFEISSPLRGGASDSRAWSIRGGCGDRCRRRPVRRGDSFRAKRFGSCCRFRRRRWIPGRRRGRRGRRGDRRVKEPSVACFGREQDKLADGDNASVLSGGPSLDVANLVGESKPRAVEHSFARSGLDRPLRGAKRWTSSPSCSASSWSSLSVLSLFDVVVIRVFEGLPGSASRAL